MKRIRLHPLLAGWLAAVVFWLALWAVGSAQTAYYAARGLYGPLAIEADQLALSSLVETEDPRTGEGGWYVSSDTDPRMEWAGRRFVDTVTLTMPSLRPTGAVVLYYKTPGQADYSVKQMVYAQKTGPDTYRFQLGGKLVDGLRIDPASQGGVFVSPQTVWLDPSGSWLRRLVPNGLQAAALLGAGPVLAALAALVPHKREKTKE